MMITTIKPDGTTIRSENAGPVSLERLQKMVGGYAQKLPAPAIEEIYVNEDGRMQQLDPNHAATKRARWPYPLLGTVVFITR